MNDLTKNKQNKNSTFSWDASAINFLVSNYPNRGKLWCQEVMGLTEGSIRAKASELKLRQNRDSEFFKDWQKRAAKSKVGKKRPDQAAVIKKSHDEGKLLWSKESRERASIAVKEHIRNNGHPRGALGMKHTEEAKKLMSEASKRMWKDPLHVVNSPEHRQKLSDRQSRFMRKRLLQEGGGNIYSHVKSKTVDIGGNVFFARSSWEANIAAYFQFLLENGEILKWEHEPKTFWFEEIRRGVRSYLPDFRITEKNGDIKYVEVKGYMDAKSKTKIRRMAKYYPNEKLEVIAQKEYKSIEKNKSLFRYWGAMDSSDIVIRTCSIDGCEGKHVAKSFCRKHYNEFK